MGFNSDVDGKASMIIHFMHAAKLVVIRLILIKESNAGMNGCTTNTEVRVVDGRRLHGGRQLHGGEQLHGGRSALKHRSDQAVGVGVDSR